MSFGELSAAIPRSDAICDDVSRGIRPLTENMNVRRWTIDCEIMDSNDIRPYLGARGSRVHGIEMVF
jgi:hypothetical protein